MRQRVEKDLARIRSFLRRHISEQGFTLRQVEEEIGWGRSRAGALLRGVRPLHVEHILQILNAIGVPPEEFWGDVYRFDRSVADVKEDLASVKASLDVVMAALEKASLLGASELERAVAAARAASR